MHYYGTVTYVQRFLPERVELYDSQHVQQGHKTDSSFFRVSRSALVRLPKLPRILQILSNVSSMEKLTSHLAARPAVAALV